MITGLAPTKTPVIHLWYQEGTLSWRTCLFWNCWQAVAMRCFHSNFNSFSIAVRTTPDQYPFDFRGIFDQLSTQVPLIPVKFRTIFDTGPFDSRRIFDQLSTHIRWFCVWFPINLWHMFTKFSTSSTTPLRRTMTNYGDFGLFLSDDDFLGPCYVIF